MFKYFKESFARKKARRVTREYPPNIVTFDIGKYGSIEFADWANPLIHHVIIDSPMVEFFNQFIKEGDLAVDIGANIGDTTVPMAICTGISGLTIGFDPNPYVYKILKINASLNVDKYHIDHYPYAISTQNEEFYFISSEASFGNGFISPTSKSKDGKFVIADKVKGVNLESFLEEEYPQQIQKLSFIKIDAEGYDKEIIKSIDNLINKYKPVIIAESFGKSSHAAKMELFEVIEKNGYEIFYFEDFNIHLKIEKIDKKKDMIRYKDTINIYAIPK